MGLVGAVDQADSDSVETPKENASARGKEEEAKKEGTENAKDNKDIEAATEKPLPPKAKFQIVCPTCAIVISLPNRVSEVSCPKCNLCMQVSFDEKDLKQIEKERGAQLKAAEKARKARPFYVDRKVLAAFKVTTPQQHNYVDCALFMMHNMELFLKHYGRSPETFRYADVVTRCAKIGINQKWFEISSMFNKRDSLRRDLLKLRTQPDSTVNVKL